MDIVRKMREIVNKNTKYYKSDFDIDVEMLKEALTEKDSETDFIWISRNCGTNLLPLINVVDKGSSANSIFNYYTDFPDALLYYVGIIEEQDGIIDGIMQQLSYKAFAKLVNQTANKDYFTDKEKADMLLEEI